MALSAANKAISVPTQHYVGFSKRGDDEIPLGFMVPDGEDAGALKRKKTVDDWASRSHNKIDATSFENAPQIGFKLGRNIRHGGYGWGQGNVKWRIEDPRGFELEISSPNLAQVMTCTVIEQGEILEACVWGRLGAENILLPVSSDVYKAAVSNTERMNTKASLKDLKIGDYVTMQNGDEGEFMGSFFMIEVERYGGERKAKFGNKKKFMIRCESEEGKTDFQAIGSPKLSAIEPREEKKIEDNEKVINDLIASGANVHGVSYVVAVSAHSSYGVEPAYELRQFESFQAASDFNSEGRYSGEIYGEHGGKFGIYNRYGGYRQTPTPVYNFSAINKQALVERQTVTHLQTGGGYFRNNDSFEVPQTETIDWRRLIMRFETKNGTQVQVVF